LPTLSVSKQSAVDHIRQLSFGRAHRFTTAFVFCEFARVVVTALSGCCGSG
jgi:hypothetical protein